MPKKCHHENIVFAQPGEMIYNVRGEKETVEYEEETFEGNEDGEYFCRDCQMLLGNSEDNIKKYL